MTESHQEDLEDLLARRLIKQPEKDERGVETSDDSATPTDRGGEAARPDDPKISDTTSSDPTPDELETDPDTKLQTAVTVAQPAFAKVEKSLISLGFFTPSSRRIKDQKVKRISFTRSIDGKKVEATAEFHPSAIFGLPVTADQDKFLALHDIITNTLRTEGKITNPIRFTSATLLRLLNNRVRTGKNYKDICEWLDVMTATMIISNGVVYEAGKHRFARDRFHVFERAVSVGKELPDGTIADANYVWLSEWQLENINQNFLLPIDLRTYRELKNHIAKALVPLLQVWLFASQKAGSFEKRYDELCEMLSLQIYKAPSLITRQLKPSLDELTHYEYLEKWRIEKTSDRKAYKIIFFHGSKFHRDRRRRLEQKNQNEPAIVIAESQAIEPDLPEPGRLEPEPDGSGVPGNNLGNGTTSSPPARGQETVNPKILAELTTCGIFESEAAKLLAGASKEQLERIGDYIDYWRLIPGEKKTAGLLHSLIKKGDPLPSSFETRRQRKERLAAGERRNKFMVVKNALTTDYEEYREATLDRFISEELTAEEFERRVSDRKREIERSHQTELWNQWKTPEALDQVARHEVRAQIREQVNFLSFEDFRKRELPRILAELNLNPAEFGLSPKDEPIRENGIAQDAV